MMTTISDDRSVVPASGRDRALLSFGWFLVFSLGAMPLVDRAVGRPTSLAVPGAVVLFATVASATLIRERHPWLRLVLHIYGQVMIWLSQLHRNGCSALPLGEMSVPEGYVGSCSRERPWGGHLPVRPGRRATAADGSPLPCPRVRKFSCSCLFQVPRKKRDGTTMRTKRIWSLASAGDPLIKSGCRSALKHVGYIRSIGASSPI